MIKRDSYIQHIKPFINKQLIKILTGQRRVGKSSILKLIEDELKANQSNANFIFIDKEDFEFDNIRTADDLMNFVKLHQKDTMNYLFIDEVQEIQDFERVLRSLYKKSNFDIYCTGSNAKVFSSELSTFLSGRQIAIHVGSLSFNEFCLFHNLSPNNDTLFKYLKYGGLPYLIHLPEDDQIRFEYLENIYTTILFRDIVNRHQIRDPRFLTDLLKFIADNSGSLFSANKISKYLKSQGIKKNVALILNYLSYLKDAYFINKVERTDIQGKKHFDIGEKYYFEDIGLRNSIVGFKMQDLAKIIENIVFLHLKNNNYEVKIGALGAKEIDFVGIKNNEKIYVQVSYLLSEEKTIKREFGNLLEIKDNYPKYVVSFDSFSTPNTYKGIKYYTLLEFLSDFK